MEILRESLFDALPTEKLERLEAKRVRVFCGLKDYPGAKIHPKPDSGS